MSEGQNEVREIIPATAETVAPLDLSMYRLPGDPPLEGKDIKRYMDSNNRLISSLGALISRGLADTDPQVRKVAIRTISSVPESERATFIKEALADADSYVRRVAVGAISSAPENERAGIIKEALGDTDPLVREVAAKRISSAPESEQDQLYALLIPLIKKGLSDSNSSVRCAATRIISSAPENERLPFSKKALADTDYNVRWLAVETLPSLSEDQRLPLLNIALADNKFQVRARAAKAISSAPENERAKLVEKALADIHRAVRGEAASTIPSLPEDKKLQMLNIALADSDPEVHEVAAKILSDMTEDKDEIKQNTSSDPNRLDELRSLATTTPLYNEPGDKRFLQYGFTKTGSDLLLLDIVPGSDRSLRERVIKRIIPMDAYFAWKKAYEASDFWKSMGFDYVPIEPIVSVSESKKKNMQADVYARVLRGPTAARWVRESEGMHGKHIKDLIKKIQTGLDKLGTHHGHLHESNFVLVFDKDQEGNPDLNNPPHVYAIDFDQAKSRADRR